jgi:predicted DNA binding protein
MGIVAEFSIPASELVLGRALKRTPGLEARFLRLVPTNGERVPYISVSGENRAGFAAALERTHGTAECEAVDESESHTLYRVSWNGEVDSVFRIVAEADVVLDEAAGNDDRWEFRIRCPNSRALSECHAACQKAGIDIEVQRVYERAELETAPTYGLTDHQRLLVERAYDSGYFEVPRRVTLQEIAEQVGVSDQAVNERLRRGLGALVASTLKSELRVEAD